MRSLAALGAFALVLGSALPALANGRFPEAQRLLEHPSDPNRLYLTGTWGMLLTHDRGQNWYYVCESAFALEYVEGDPLLEVLPGGELVAGIRRTLNTSTDCACSWTPTLAEPELENVVDVTLGTDGTLVALVQDITTPPSRLFLFESTDRGQSWQKFSELPAELPLGFTVDVAPSDPTRLYATAAASSRPTGILLVSDDRGQTWDEREIPGSSSSVQPFIAAVSPTDPDVVYVRTNDWNGMGDFAANDALLVTGDAGETFEPILQHQAKLLGFALSPDGSTVLAGYGDPVVPGFSTNWEEFGLYKASTSDFAFERILDEGVSCLRWNGSGVYACVPNLDDVPSPDLALGFAPNADFTLADENPLTPLLDTRLVRGALACSGAICEETWRTGLEGNVPVCRALRADCEAPPSTDTLTCPMDPGGDGGAGGETGTGGTTGGTSAGAAGAATGGVTTGGAAGSGAGRANGGQGNTGAAGGSNDDDDDNGGDGGCGCRSSVAPSRTTGVALAALLALSALRRRRARRSA